jgi:uncharacterized Fe-S cluster-containing radical SAM superfamily enzyme
LASVRLPKGCALKFVFASTDNAEARKTKRVDFTNRIS